MEFTGERMIPGVPGHEDLFLEHVVRYRFASHFAPGKKMLDTGCGCGYGSYHLARNGADSVLGIDLSPEAIAYGREHFKHERLTFRTGDVLDTGLEEASFDTITAFEVFEHLRDPGRFLAETRRLLKPGGVFILSTPNAHTYVAGGEHGKNPYHVREYTPEEFAGLLEECFEQVSLYAQSPWAGLSIFPVLADTSDTHVDARAGLVLPPTESAWGEAAPAVVTPAACAYVVAVCGDSSIDRATLPSGRLYAMARDLGRPSEDRARWTKQAQDLEAELDGRTRWVEILQRSLDERDETIRKLQMEFEERSQWAQELDRTVQAQARLIAALRRQRVDVQ